jgi:ATP synthase protein I
MVGPGDRERQGRGNEGLSSLADAYRKAAPYTAASTSLVIAVAGCTWLGHEADQWLGMGGPWLTLAGALIGMTGGFIGFFRTVLGSARKK